MANAAELKPGLFIDYVCLHKFLVGFCQIYYSFDDAYDGRDQHKRCTDAARNDRYDERHEVNGKKDNALLGIAQNELVNTKAAENYPAYPGGYLFLGTCRR